MEGLRVDRGHAHVAVVTIDRPQRANALDDELIYDAFPALLGSLAADPEVRVLVVTGAGGYFCAGVDLDSESFGAPDAAATAALVRKAQQAVVTLRRMPQPSIAAVDGPAVGAGLGLAIACDIRIATPRARFVAPFVRMGLVPDYGCSYFLPQLLGMPAALDVALTGRPVLAEEALAIGLVDRVEEDALAAGVALAERIAECPPGAVATTRRNMYLSALAGLEAMALEIEPQSVGIALHGAEFKESFARYRASLAASAAARTAEAPA